MVYVNYISVKLGGWNKEAVGAGFEAEEKTNAKASRTGETRVVLGADRQYEHNIEEKGIWQ